MLENNYFNLLLGVPDTDLAKIIESTLKTGSIFNEIYERIDQCLDKKGLQMKQERLLDEKYIDGRRSRSAVESLMFSLKYVVNFGRLRRRGIEAVKCEMPGKVIAYNYLHKIRKFESSERLYEKAA